MVSKKGPFSLADLELEPMATSSNQVEPKTGRANFQVDMRSHQERRQLADRRGSIRFESDRRSLTDRRKNGDMWGTAV